MRLVEVLLLLSTLIYFLTKPSTSIPANPHNFLSGSSGSTTLYMHSPPRLLVTITAHNFNRWDAIDDLLENYRNICEGGWDIKIYFLTVANWSPRLASWISRNLHCSRLSSEPSFVNEDLYSSGNGNKNSDSVIPFVLLKINNRSIGNRIVDYSRLPTALEINNFDVFFYGEDDILFTLSHLNNWLLETKKLARLTHNRVIKDVERCGAKYTCSFAIGFLRFWRKNAYSKVEIDYLMDKYKDSLHHNAQDYTSNPLTSKQKHIEEFITYSLQDLVNIEKFDKKITENRSIYIEQQSDQESSIEATLGRHQARSGGQLWFDAAIYDKNRLEEIPTFDKICIAGEPYIALRSSPHQASWILHKDEILRINTTCNFLTMTWDKSWKNQGFVREYMSSYSIYSNPFHTRIPVNCMLNKVIPAGKLEIFKIRHYQRSKWSKSNGPSVYWSEEALSQGSPHEGLDRLAGRQARKADKDLSNILPGCWN